MSKAETYSSSSSKRVCIFWSLQIDGHEDITPDFGIAGHAPLSFIVLCKSVFTFLKKVLSRLLVLSQTTLAEVLEAVALTDEDFANAEKLTKEDIYSVASPIESINGYKSDIRGPVADSKRFRRNGVSRPTKLWPHARIPYAISPHYSTHERALLAKAVKQVRKNILIKLSISFFSITTRLVFDLCLGHREKEITCLLGKSTAVSPKSDGPRAFKYFHLIMVAWNTQQLSMK